MGLSYVDEVEVLLWAPLEAKSLILALDLPIRIRCRERLVDVRAQEVSRRRYRSRLNQRDQEEGIKEEADTADHVSRLPTSNLRHLLVVEYGFRLATMTKNLAARQSPSTRAVQTTCLSVLVLIIEVEYHLLLWLFICRFQLTASSSA